MPRTGIVTAFLGNLRAGTWVYTWHLLRGLANSGGVVRIDREERHLDGLEGIPTAVIPGGGALAKLTWPALYLPAGTERAGIDLLHITTPYGCLRRTRCRKVITICDVTPLLFPEAHGKMNVWHHRLVLPSILRQADHVITISESSRSDIIAHYGVPGEKISVTLLAADERFYHAPPRQDTAGRPYILNVGTLEPRKNIPLLLRAFAAARRSGLPHRLVIVGASGWGKSPLAALVHELGLGDDVQFSGFVSDDELPGLYSGADFFVYPSLYEGFGLPVLEAMACGTPVITSTVSSLPEVAGDAALLVDPRSEDELCRAMLRVAGDGELRDMLRERGKERAGKFSWSRTVEETRRIYNKIL